MPFLTPKKSGVHRIACLSLYRALLQQSSRVTGVRLPFLGSSTASHPTRVAKSQDEAYTAFDTLRRQFRASTCLQGRQIVSALQIGYEALHSLRSTTSPLDQTALSRLARDLRMLYPQSVSSPASPSPGAISSHPQSAEHGITPSERPNAGPRVWRHSSTSPTQAHILQRPLLKSQLSGKRHVPRLAQTGGITFLRITKPQPAYLSRIIRDKRRGHQKRLDAFQELEGRWLPLAEAEDVWEVRVQQMLQRAASQQELSSSSSSISSEEPKYTEAVRIAAANIQRLRARDRARNRRVGERLLAIVHAERQLKFDEEGVWHPLRGTSPERRAIIARQRHARREEKAARRAADVVRAKERKERKALRRVDEHAPPFVVQLEGQEREGERAAGSAAAAAEAAAEAETTPRA